VIVETSQQPARSVTRPVLQVLIYLYRAVTVNRRPACRFVPSCSQYAIEALDRFGARKGLPLVLRRLGRCRPRGPFGFDPVPPLSPVPGEEAQQ
jgi:putative membrane protein insertion efficiency factor